MHKEQLVGIGIRLFAVFVALYTIRQAAGFIQYLSDRDASSAAIASIVAVMLVLLFAAIVLWKFPLTIAAKLIPKAPDTDYAWTADATSVTAVAFPLMGIWVLASAIPDLSYWLVYAYVYANSDLGTPPFPPESVGGMVATLVELSIGVWLVLGSRNLSRLLHWLRFAGAPAT